MSGNERAKAVLELPQRVDLFIVGHGEPEGMRREIVAWLKSRYPNTPILALNPGENQRLAEADFNVVLNGTEAWLAKVDDGVGMRRREDDGLSEEPRREAESSCLEGRRDERRKAKSRFLVVTPAYGGLRPSE